MSAPTPAARSGPAVRLARGPRLRHGVSGIAVAGLAVLLAAGCGRQGAIGEANTLVLVTASDSLWRQVRDTTKAVLEPIFFST